MIGIDTNVLVRYVTQDDPVQSARANEFIDQLSKETPGFVTVVSLAEIYWVLHRAYQADRKSIMTVLEGLLESRELVVERGEMVRRALARAVAGADFPDALITETGIDAGCERTVTFDRHAAKVAGMQLLGS